MNGRPPAIAEGEAVETLTLGVGDQGGPEFSYISSVAVGPGGELLLVDRMLQEVFLFDAQGSLLRTIGRKGQGPGEFQDPVDAGYHGDSIWVWDWRLKRLTWFDPRGRTLGSRTFPLEQMPGRPWVSHGGLPLRDGAFLLRVEMLSQIAADTALPVPVLLLNGDGERRLVAELPVEYPSQVAIPRTGSEWPIYSSQPINAEPLVGVERGGSWFFALRQPVRSADDPVVTITRYDPTGRLVSVIAIPFTPVAMRGDARDTLTDVFLDATPPELRSSLVRSQVARAWAVPEIFPPVQRAFADSAGFWLRREGLRWLPDPVRWERYDLEGILVASVQLPGDLRGLAATPTSIIGSRTGAFDVPTLHRYEVKQ